MLVSEIDDVLQISDNIFRKLGSKIIISISHGVIHQCDSETHTNTLKNYVSECIDEAINLAINYNKSEGSNYMKPRLLSRQKIKDEFKSLTFRHLNIKHSVYFKEYDYSTNSEEIQSSILPTFEVYSLLYINLHLKNKEKDIKTLLWRIDELKKDWQIFRSSNKNENSNSNEYILPVSNGLLIVSKNPEILLSFADKHIRHAEQDREFYIRAGLGMGNMCLIHNSVPCFSSFVLVKTEQMVLDCEYPIAIDTNYFSHIDPRTKKGLECDLVKVSKNGTIYFYFLDYPVKFSSLHEIIDLQEKHQANLIYVVSFHFIINRLKGKQQEAAIKDILDALTSNPDRKYLYIQLGDDNSINKLPGYIKEIAKKENLLTIVDRITFWKSYNSSFEAWPIFKKATRNFTLTKHSSLFQTLKPHLVIWYSEIDKRPIAVMNVSWKPKIREDANYRGWVYLDKEDANKMYYLVKEMKMIPIPKTQDTDMNIEFDVFLSYNSEDLSTVKELSKKLKKRGLKVWLDKDEVVPGDRWQDELEKIIQTTKTAAVIVGKKGIGPWEKLEWQSILSENVDRGLRVIPVLLPEASSQPIIPIFLKAINWVDFRGGITEEKLILLEKGIKKI